MAYDAFISYNHKADMAFARALDDGLRKLARPWNRLRALNVFRDEHSLSGDPGLWSSIEKHLLPARYFVLLASTESAQSEWCDREVKAFLAKNSVARVLLVVTDGTIKWDPEEELGGPGTNCIPPALQKAFTEQPHYINGRELRSSSNLTLRNPDFANLVADIAAPIHGKSKDEIFGEDIRQHRRATLLRRAAIGGLATLTLIAVGLGAYALNRAQVAEDRRVQAEEARNDALDAQAFAEQKQVEAETAEALAENRRKETEAEKVRALRSLFSAYTLYMVEGQPGSLCLSGLCPAAPPGDGGTWTSLSRLSDTLLRFGDSPEVSRHFIAARQFGAGHVLAYAHDGLIRDGEIKKGGDNLAFAENALRWLAGPTNPGCPGGTTILFWPGSFLPLGNVSAVADFVRLRGWKLVATGPSTLEADLRCAAALWWSSDWRPPADFATKHVPLIERFVRDGGGLLAGGLGWSYPNRGIAAYAGDELGKPFGFAFTTEGFVVDANKPIPLLAAR